MRKKKAKNWRCKVDATVGLRKEERTIRLGPGMIIDEALHAELMDRKLAEPEWFEEVSESAPQEESETEP